MYINYGKRLPFGAFLGAYSNVSTLKLASVLAEDACEKSPVSPCGFALGCVLQAGCGQAFAKNVLLECEEPMNIPALTINKVCGSGLASIIYGLKTLAFDDNTFSFLAGGVENLSQAPHLANLRRGKKMGDLKFQDHMILDGLKDVSSGSLMGELAEYLAFKYNISREEQEDYVVKSFHDYQENKSLIAKDVIPCVLNGKTLLQEDEAPNFVNLEKMKKLKPAFLPDGSITAATSSSLADGAAFVMISREKVCDDCVEILGVAEYSGHPKSFAEAPVFAVSRLLKKIGKEASDIKFFEINEAFAVVPLAFQKAYGLKREQINPYGGACIVGHPLAASGVRILINLIRALRESGGGVGIASVCIGGGEGLAIAIEV